MDDLTYTFRGCIPKGSGVCAADFVPNDNPIATNAIGEECGGKDVVPTSALLGIDPLNAYDLTDWDHNDDGSGDGVIIAADENQEWMLKWWWENYSKENAFPVTFFDLGMSKSARLWCGSKGDVIPFAFPDGWIKPREAITSDEIEEWEKKYQGDLWEGRTQWFCKPYVLLRSPYVRTVWMDLDCEVRSSIAELFDYCNEGDGFSILKLSLENLDLFSAGVVVSKRLSPVTKKWAENIYHENHKHFGDENVLIETLNKEKFKITPYPLIYNWPTIIPQSCKTVIRHHIGGYGKTKILGGLSVV
ncbi:hypothetical protein [Candidatus Neptunochlamydia vexilliferae]|nr:hypothetical protein [Candidatus Neptunochlamydia vexilliferae]